MQTIEGAAATVDGVPPTTGPARDTGADGHAARAVPPLAIDAFMVSKEALVTALRLYVPHLTDVEAIPGDRFLLYVGPEHPDGAEVR